MASPRRQIKEFNIKKSPNLIFWISAFFIVTCMIYIYLFMQSTRDGLRNVSSWVDHSQEVILLTETLVGEFEGALAEQRGYLISGDHAYVKRLTDRKDKLISDSQKLIQVTVDNKEQNQRAKEINKLAITYASIVLERMSQFANIDVRKQGRDNEEFIRGAQEIEKLHTAFYQKTNEFLNKEYSILRERIKATNEGREQFTDKFIASLIASCMFILFMNWIMFASQRKMLLERQRAQIVDDRYSVALKAANDGLFDWDIKEKRIFLSAQIFKMCGYDKDDYEGTLMGVIVHMGGKNPLDLIHTEDVERFHSRLSLFSEGKTSEYRNEFRVKHADGYWMWVSARGGGLYNDDGKPVRLIGSHADVTAAKQLEMRLRSERTDAENLSKRRMEFLAHMSHEIRTPLTAITGVSEILNSLSSRFDDKVNKMISTLNTSALSLRDLVNDILDFSRIDSGEVQLINEGIQLGQLFSDIEKIFTVQVINKGLKLTFEGEDVSTLIFEGDYIRLRQVLINLVGNAIKFTDAGGVTVRARAKKSFNPLNPKVTLRIDVIDTGVGISEENLDRIFDKFAQADDTISKAYSGTGLGLTISRKLIELMDGTITVTSKPDEGSIFTITLPIKVLNYEEILDKISTTAEVDIRSEKDIKKTSTVLVAEDYEGNVVVLDYILKDLGLNYDVATNGSEAVTLFKTKKYDLVLMDIQMPILDGLSATKAIRVYEQENNLFAVPILGMTAHVSSTDMNRCKDVGMNNFMVKPLNQNLFREMVLNYINERDEEAA